MPPHPRGGVVVPVVAGIRQAAERRFDVVPASFVVKTALDQFGDERASPSWARASINLRHEVIGECYVQTHGPKCSIVRTHMATAILPSCKPHRGG